MAGINFGLKSSVTSGMGPVINVKDAAFGAKGDGSTNDTSAIAAAIAAVPSGGGTVFFPAGTYVANVSLSGVSNIMLQGVGHASVIAPSSGTGVSIVGCSRCDMSNLRITGGVTGLSIQGDLDSAFSNIHIDGCSGDGLFVQGDGSGGNGCELFFANCVMRNIAGYGYHYHKTVTTDTGGVNFSNCNVVGPPAGASGGMYIETTQSGGADVFHNILGGSMGDGYAGVPAVHITNAGNIRVQGGWIGAVNNGGPALLIDGASKNHQYNGINLINSGTGAGTYGITVAGTATFLQFNTFDFFGGSMTALVHVTSSGQNFLFGDYFQSANVPFTDTAAITYSRNSTLWQRGPMVFQTDSSGTAGGAIGIDDIRNAGVTKYIRNENGVLAFINAAFNQDLFQMDDAGNVLLHGHLQIGSRPAFVTGDKYLIVDSSGNVHVSSLGPAS